MHGLLHSVGLTVSRRGISKFIYKYYKVGSICRGPESGRLFNVTGELKLVVEKKMLTSDKTSVYQLRCLLRLCECNIALRTILQSRKVLGWTFCGCTYFQLVWNAIKQKYVLDSVVHISSDEWTVQLESHRRDCRRKKGHPAKYKPKYGSTSIHVHVYVHLKQRKLRKR